ncbi:MAG: type VI secretion system baseplate subunit TssE [Acidobacteria bacterium]|nr:type VI secretion system baseplate subunit TssE [Acidobacteriota bacterium]
MRQRFNPEAGFLEKMLGPLPGESPKTGLRWIGDPIRDHLGLLLNARRGTVEHLPDYGMPDMASFYADYPASLAGLRTVVEELIQKYEPRLQNVQVRLIEADTGEFRISLTITGEIEEAEGGSRVTYRTTIHRDGRTELNEN